MMGKAPWLQPFSRDFVAARSLAGHLVAGVAGVAGDEEVQDFKKLCENLC